MRRFRLHSISDVIVDSEPMPAWHSARATAHDLGASPIELPTTLPSIQEYELCTGDEPIFRAPKFESALLRLEHLVDGDSKVLSSENRWPTYLRVNNLQAVSAKMLETAPEGLTLESSLRDWQRHWVKESVFIEIMAASLPHAIRPSLVRLNMREQSKGRGRLANLDEWPLIGLEEAVESERKLLNELSASGVRLNRRYVIRKNKWHLNLKRRIGDHFNNCTHQGLDAALSSWLRVWRDTGVMRTMSAAVSGRALPSFAGNFISESEIQKSYLFSRFKTSCSYQLTVSSNPSESYQVSKKTMVDAGSIYQVDGALFYGSSETGSQLPIDSIGITQGFSHHTSEVSPWCPLRLVANEMTRLGLQKSDGRHFKLMGLTITKSGNAASVNPELLDTIKKLPAASESKNRSLRLTNLPTSRMLGLLPATWLSTDKVTDEPHLIRNMRLDEALVSHWLGSVRRVICHEDSNEVLRLRNPKLKNVSDINAHQFCTDLISLANDGITSVAGTVNVSGFQNEKGSVYRVPLVSIILEEAVALMELATVPKDNPQGLKFSVRIKSNRKSLHLIRVVFRSLYRSGFDTHDLHLFLKSLLVDLLSGYTSDLCVRYQMVRVGDDKYRLTALPFWSFASHTFKKDHLSEFSGLVTISPTLGEELIASKPMRILLSRHTGISVGFINSSISAIQCELTKQGREYAHCERFLKMTDRHNSFRIPKFQ
ncbi:hypothetical protein LCGC14_0282950 [marine sediment metagenome]|uniref:Uncharacterized protein n=1 Tax=marine sediment metagenome TaxID=412755 RepID=A0A0F9WGT5_9ZZZZ